MYREAWTLTYLMNVIFQAFFSLILQILFSLFLGYLAVEKLGAPRWVYVPIILIGTFVALFSMIKFLMTASKTLEKTEKERKEKELERKNSQNENNN